MPLKETVFTKEQDNIIIQNYGKKTAKEIALLINKETYNVQRRAKKLGVWVNGTEKKWTLEEDNYLKTNYPLIGAKETAEKLNRGYDATKKRAKVLGISEEAADKWTDEEIALLTEQYGKMSYEEMVEKYFPNRNVSGLEHKASRLKLTEGHYHNVNHDFFEKPNLLNSYIAGFIAADGCVLDSRPSLIINLNERDGEHLQNMIKHITNADVVYKYKKNYHKNKKWNFDGSNAVDIQINSSKLLKDLKNNFNIVPRKSLIYEPPTQLSFENAIAFIIGNLDGDGSIKIRQHKQFKYGKEYIYPTMAFQFLGTYNFLVWVKNTLNNIIDISDCNVKNTSSIYQLNISGKKAIELFQILRVVNVPKMERKWNKPELKIISGLK
jgi:hypothetical protein